MIILRQKQYNILGDLYHSGVKRTGKKWIGRLRSNAALKVGKKAIKNSRTFAGKSYQANVNDPVKISNREILDKTAKKLNANVSRGDFYGLELGSTVNNKDLAGVDISSLGVTDKDKKILKSAIRNAKSNKNGSQVFLQSDAGDEALAHELGHQLNRVSKNPITRKRNQISTKFRTKFNPDPTDNPNLRKYVKYTVLGKTIEHEEKSASKKGYKLLKKSGATKKQLEKAKENYKTNLDTYRYLRRAQSDSILANALNVKGNKVKTTGPSNTYHTLSGKRIKIQDLQGEW